MANANASAIGSGINTGKQPTTHAPTITNPNANTNSAKPNPTSDSDPSRSLTSVAPIHSYDFASQQENNANDSEDSIDIGDSKHEVQQDDDTAGAKATAATMANEKTRTRKKHQPNISHLDQSPDGVDGLCNVMSFLNIKRAIASESSSSSKLFAQPPGFINGAGALISMKDDTWFKQSDRHWKGKPTLTAPTLSPETLEDATRVRMCHFINQPRDVVLANELNITFSEQAFVHNADIQSLHLPTFLRNVGEARAKIYEMDGGKQGSDSVSIIMTHEAFVEIRNRFDYGNMHRLWRELLRGMALRTVHQMSDADKYTNPELCGFNPLIDLKADEYSLAFEVEVSTGTGSTYANRARRVRRYNLVVNVKPDSNWHKANNYGQLICLWPNVYLRDERVGIRIRTNKSNDQVGFIKLSGTAFENTTAAAAYRKTVDLTAIVNLSVSTKCQNLILRTYLTDLQNAGYSTKHVSFIRSADRARAMSDKTVQLSDKLWNDNYGSKSDKHKALGQKGADDHADHKMADHHGEPNDFIPQDEDFHTKQYETDFVMRMVKVLLSFDKRTNDEQPIPVPVWLDAEWALKIMHDKMHPRALSRLQPEMTSTAARNSHNKDAACAATNHYIARCQGIPIDLAIGIYNTELGKIKIEQHAVQMATRILQLLPKCAYCNELSHKFHNCPWKRLDKIRCNQIPDKTQRRCLRCWSSHMGPCRAQKPRCGKCGGEHYLSSDNSECPVVVTLCQIIENGVWVWRRKINIDGLHATQLLDLNRETLEVPALVKGAHKVMEMDNTTEDLPVAPPLEEHDATAKPKKPSMRQQSRKALSQSDVGRVTTPLNVHGKRKRRKPQPHSGHRHSQSRSRSGSRTSQSSDKRMQYRQRQKKKKTKHSNMTSDNRRKHGSQQRYRRRDE